MGRMPIASLLNMKNSRNLLILIFALSAARCSGKVTYDLNQAGIILRSSDLTLQTPVFQSVVDVMKRARLPESKDIRAAMFKVVADHYLAKEYRKNKGKQIDPAISAEIEKVYYETLAFYIREKNPQALYKAYIGKITIPSADELKKLFDGNAPAAYTNVPLKRDLAEKVVLAQYGKDKKKILTLVQVFDALPQAGKLHLFTSPNAQALDEMINTHLRREFLNDFVAEAPPQEKAEFATLRMIVENSILSRNLRYDMGMENANPHAENSAVKERAKSVSLSRIKEYYEANKDKYKEVQTVDCRHIKLKSYDQAQNLRDQIEHKADMIALVKKHSLADDKNAAEPGLIKGIKNDTELHKRPRIETLCMSPKQGEVDVVKDGEFYEVVKAEKRVDGYPPLDETTHLQQDLARELAAMDLKKEFDAKKTAILKKVDIRINKTELEKIK